MHCGKKPKYSLKHKETMPPEQLNTVVRNSFDTISLERQRYNYAFQPREVGYIKSVSSGIVRISGLPGAGYEEMLKFPSGLSGIAYNIDAHEIGAIIMGDYSRLAAGDEVERTGRVMDIGVGKALLGRVINPLGEPLDEKGAIHFDDRFPIERPSPSIMDRLAVNVPLQTGLKAIDALIPVGRGQRELILGDRQTGKTAIALDTIINQRDKNVVCIYCAIGQRTSAVAKVISCLKESAAMEYTIVVVTEGNSSPGLKYIAPYAATSVAEYFMEKGSDVLIVYDDLTHHATAYRELSLLLRRPPGREAFPGDIFYIHSRLLERATHLKKELGGGSLTALPIIETEAQNISDYIPTNLISITDGQIYLSPQLFELGILPAVDVGKSVSRVGGKAQLKAYGNITGNLKLAYSQFEELENYARFGTRLDEHTQKIITHGKRIRAWLQQPELHPMSVPEQMTLLIALNHGLFDRVPLEKMQVAEASLIEGIKALPVGVSQQLFAGTELTETIEASILALAAKTLASFEVTEDKNENNQ